MDEVTNLSQRQTPHTVIDLSSTYKKIVWWCLTLSATFMQLMKSENIGILKPYIKTVHCKALELEVKAIKITSL